MGHEEVVDVVEHRAQRRGSQLAEGVAEVHAARAPAREAETVADPLRGVHGVGIHAVLRRLAPQLLLAAEVRAQPALGRRGRRSGCR